MSFIEQAPATDPEGNVGRQPDHCTGPNPRRIAVVTAVALTLVALAPIIAVLIQRWGRVYVPVSDQAIIDLRIRDVWTFSSATPLTGPYSRFGWNHPGPTMYYLLAMFSGAAGRPAWASLVGNILIQGVAVVWTARLSWTSGGLRWMMPWLAVITLSYWATGPEVFLQLWNPNLLYPYFTLLLLQAWLVGIGEGKRLVGMAFVSSLLIQTHVGYALPVLAVSLWAVARLRASERRSGRSVRRWALWWPPLAVLAVVWFVPLAVDTVAHFPGNSVRLVRFYLGLGGTPSLPYLGIHRALGYLAAEFRWRPPWLGGPDPLGDFSAVTSPAALAYLAVPVILIGASWGLARWRKRAELVAAAELMAVAVAAGAAALALLEGPPYPYLFYWRIPLASATVVLCLVVLAGTLPRLRPPAPLVLCVVLGLLMALSSISFTRTVAAADGPVAPMEPVAASIIRQLDHDGLPPAKVLVRYFGSPLGGLHAALVDQLSRQGAPVFVDQALGFQFGYSRTAARSQVGSVWYVTEESELYSLISRASGARVLAVSHPLPPARQAELVALQRTLSDELTAAGHAHDVGYLFSPYVARALAGIPGLSTPGLRRLATLNAVVARHVCLCSVIAFPPDRLPAFLSSR